MINLAFYDAGCGEPSPAGRIKDLPRRLLRRILRPIFLRQAEILHGMVARLDAGERTEAEFWDALHRISSRLDIVEARADSLAERSQVILAFGWDYAAAVRRLAALEDRVEALSARDQPSASSVRMPESGPHSLVG